MIRYSWAMGSLLKQITEFCITRGTTNNMHMMHAKKKQDGKICARLLVVIFSYLFQLQKTEGEHMEAGECGEEWHDNLQRYNLKQHTQ
jgi:hypothetical protein